LRESSARDQGKKQTAWREGGIVDDEGAEDEARVSPSVRIGSDHRKSDGGRQSPKAFKGGKVLDKAKDQGGKRAIRWAAKDKGRWGDRYVLSSDFSPPFPVPGLLRPPCLRLNAAPAGLCNGRLLGSRARRRAEERRRREEALARMDAGARRGTTHTRGARRTNVGRSMSRNGKASLVKDQRRAMSERGGDKLNGRGDGGHITGSFEFV